MYDTGEAVIVLTTALAGEPSQSDGVSHVFVFMSTVTIDDEWLQI